MISMKLGRLSDPPPAPQPRSARAGEVETQWRCREKHPGCEHQRWEFYRFEPAGEARERVRDWNTYSHFFEYRIKDTVKPRTK